MSGCGCRECIEQRNIRSEYRRGGIDDGWEDEPYRKGARSNWHNKRTRACKKSKTKEPCDFTVAVMLRSYFGWGEVWHHTRVITCSRCGKYGQHTYFTTKEPI